MVRYKEYLEKMLSENRELFDEFDVIHSKYVLNQDKYQDEFNTIGKKVNEIISEYESRVCANTERGMYNRFSGNLADKFRNEIRKIYPMIDHIGIKSSKADQEGKTFFIKKLL